MEWRRFVTYLSNDPRTLGSAVLISYPTSHLMPCRLK